MHVHEGYGNLFVCVLTIDVHEGYGNLFVCLLTRSCLQVLYYKLNVSIGFVLLSKDFQHRDLSKTLSFKSYNVFAHLETQASHYVVHSVDIYTLQILCITIYGNVYK